jgi:AcrR family transcriptional regulator
MARGSSKDDQKRTPAGLKRRAELMEAAVLLSAENGFSRTRVSDIVGKVGVGQGVFYWYFDSKDALFRELFEDTGRRLRLYQAAFIARETEPLRRIAKGIVASFDFIVRNAHVFAVLDHAVTRVPRRQRSEAGRVHMLDTARHIQEAIDAGKVRTMDPNYSARAISGVVNQLARDYFAVRDHDLDATIQEAIDFCLGGLLAERAVTVSEIRREVEVTPQLERLRDKVGASLNGSAPRSA